MVNVCVGVELDRVLMYVWNDGRLFIRKTRMVWDNL